MKQIQIRCKGTSALSLDSFQNFQGNLKELREPEYKKLRRSIEKYGFRFPIFVWGNMILDGHQRILVLKKMISEGWSVDPLPVIEIEAENEREAKHLLLLISSRYGHVTDDGLYEFIMTSELNFNELKEEIDLPEIDFGKFGKSYFEEKEELSIVPEKDENILIRISVHPGMWLGKREEILSVLEKMKTSYNLVFKVEE